MYVLGDQTMNYEQLTSLDRFSSALFIGFYFVPENHSQLSIFDSAGNEYFPLLFKLFNSLWCFFPGLFQRADRDSTTFASLALNFS